MIKFFKRKKEDYIYSPCNGDVVSLEEIKDEVFSSKMMGDGVGIIPNEDTIYSPCKGKVINIFETKHAIMLKTDNGNDILVHIGIDTVKLNGEPFNVRVKLGQIVELTDILVEVDFKYIINKGLDSTVIIINLNESTDSNIVNKNIKDNIKARDIIFNINKK